MASTATKSAPSTANVSTSDVEKKISRLKSDMAELGSSLRNLGGDAARGVKGDADAKIAEISSSGEEILDELRAQLASYEKQLNRTVRERPMASLGVAAGIGFLIAILFRR